MPNLFAPDGLVVLNVTMRAFVHARQFLDKIGICTGVGQMPPPPPPRGLAPRALIELSCKPACQCVTTTPQQEAVE